MKSIIVVILIQQMTKEGNEEFRNFQNQPHNSFRKEKRANVTENVS